MLALALAIGLEMMQSGLATAREVERALGLRALASVPELGSLLEKAQRGARLRPPADFLVEKPLSGFAEAFHCRKATLTVPGFEPPQ